MTLCTIVEILLPINIPSPFTVTVKKLGKSNDEQKVEHGGCVVVVHGEQEQDEYDIISGVTPSGIRYGVSDGAIILLVF